MYKSYQKQFVDELAEIKDTGMWKDEGVVEGKQGAEIVVGGKTLLNFCANNYLGLASSDELAKAAIDGNSAALEPYIAKLKEAEAANAKSASSMSTFSKAAI